jgi:hypothetical protein
MNGLNKSVRYHKNETPSFQLPPPDGLHTTLGTPSHFSKFKKNMPGGNKVADILQRAAEKSCRKMSQ